MTHLDFVDRARTEQRDVSAQLVALRQQRDGIDRKIDVLEKRQGELAAALRLYSELMDVSLEPLRPPSQSLLPTEKPKLGSVTEMAYQTLRAHGSPMKIRDIANALAKAGKFPSSEPRLQYATVFGVIRRDKRFFKAGQGVFGLTEWEGRGQEQT